MPTALAISPHLDDAVFSAGGLVARLSRHRWRVVVATVFTQSVARPAGFAMACQLDKGLSPEIDYMALRRGEDAAACAIVGAEPMWLPFREAPHRGYGSAPALFAGLRDDDHIVEQIAPVIADLVEDLRPEMVLAPQAVGAHVDHVAVYRAVARCAPAAHLWVDFPYVARRGPRPSPFALALASRPTWRVPLAPSEIGAKSEAAAAYASQLGFQFGGAPAALDAIAGGGAIEYFACTLPPSTSIESGPPDLP